MWYFTWILGVFAAIALAVINVMWYEAEQSFARANGRHDDEPGRVD